MKYVIPSIVVILLLASGCQKKRSFVVSKIMSTAKLATTETIIDKTVVGIKERRLVRLVKVGQSEFVAYSQATVLTGIDLTLLGPDDIKISQHAIEVILPPIQVLDFQYPFDSFRIDYDLSNQRFLSEIDIIDQENFYRQAELDIRKNLDKMGIIEVTETKTRQLMTSLLKNLGYEEIYITFKEGELIPQVNLTGEIATKQK